jgi:hypothetical protein
MTVLPADLCAFGKDVQVVDPKAPTQTSTVLTIAEQPLSQLPESSRMERSFVSFGDEKPRGYDGMEMEILFTR